MTLRWFPHPHPNRLILCGECSAAVGRSNGIAGVSPNCPHIATAVGGFHLFGDPDLLRACACGSTCEWLIYDRSSETLPDVLPTREEDMDDTTPEKGMIECGDCGLHVPEDSMTETHCRWDDYVTQQVCSVCVRAFAECDHCGEYVHHYRTRTVRTDYGNSCSDICRPCYDGERGSLNIEQCQHCGEDTDMEEPCCDVDPDTGRVDGCGCEGCSTTHSIVHDYSYKPRAEFHRAQGEGVTFRRNRFDEKYDATLYMGIELEVEAPGRDSDLRVQSALGDIVYLKEDSSIGDGFEIVSHPATFDYWMNEFNWEAIRKLRGDQVISSSSSCGLHIHASKNAFNGPTHEYRLIMFWHRNQEVLKVLAGRDSHYGSYDNDQRATLVDVVKKGKHSYRRSAINTQNEYTHEFRVFASTVYVNRIKAAIQLVEGSIEYTRNLAAAKVMKDGGYSWTEFIVWLRSHDGRYAQLIKRIVDLGIDCQPTRQLMPPRQRWDDTNDVYVTVPGRVIQEGK